LKLKEQVQTLFVDHQHSLASQTPHSRHLCIKPLAFSFSLT
jgi:hypothetical protein